MVNFSFREIRDIIISMLIIAIIFAYIYGQRSVQNIISLLPITFIAVGLGFVLHELAHKFVATRYGFYAEYKMWIEGLFLALITTFLLGFVFIAPGAVYIHGEYISKEQNGKISLAGPATNIILASIFFMIMYLSSIIPAIYLLSFLGFSVNSFLALFNLIPFSVLDGAKILRWNPVVWLLTAGLAFLMVIYAMFGIIII